jgi:hypothetical protein
LLASKEKESEQHAAATALGEKVSTAERPLAAALERESEQHAAATAIGESLQPAAPEKRNRGGRPRGTVKPEYKLLYEQKDSGKEWADIWQNSKISSAHQQGKIRGAYGTQKRRERQRNQAEATTKPSQKGDKTTSG